jgi:hypothetical protein
VLPQDDVVARITCIRRGSDGGRERGAAMVEFALVVVILMLLVFGIIEFSLAWNTKSQAQGAVRAGGRIASAMTRSDALTVQAAKAVESTLQSVPADEPVSVMVYRVAPGDSGAPPASCGSNCSEFAWNPATQTFDTDNDLGAGWPAENQQNNCTPDLSADSYDQVGVYVRIEHPFQVLQNFVPGMSDSVTLDPHSVFRLEPSSSAACEA